LPYPAIATHAHLSLLDVEVDLAGLVEGLEDGGFFGFGVPIDVGIDDGGEAVDPGEEECGVFFRMRSGASDVDVDGTGGGVNIVVQNGVFGLVAGGAEETPAGFEDGNRFSDVSGSAIGIEPEFADDFAVADELEMIDGDEGAEPRGEGDVLCAGGESKFVSERFAAQSEAEKRTVGGEGVAVLEGTKQWLRRRSVFRNAGIDAR